jgi:glycerophosphoryl diester phosphodiesterase
MTTQRRPFLIIGHRGAPNHAPENTIASFDKALALGFRHIELDAQLSSDGVAVVFHDDILDRTSNGRGPLAKQFLAELRRLDAGAWFSDAFKGQRIPTLEEVLSRYHGRAYLHLELKSAEPELPGIAAGLLGKHNWPLEEKESSRSWPAFGVTVSSFHKDQLDRMRPMLPGMQMAWLVQSITARVLDEGERSGFRFICPRAASVTGDSVQETLGRGFRVRAWGLRSVEDLDNLVTCDVEGTTCDWPDRAREHLRQSDVATFP